MVLTELPFGLPGRVFRSPMPFGWDNDTGETFRQYQHANVSTVVVLVGEEECRIEAGRDLRAFYIAEGLQVIDLPIPDWGVPEFAEANRAVDRTLKLARSGQNIAIHCHAGIGRTGLFSACLARRVLGLSGEEAIAWVRRVVPRAIETEEQIQFVKAFETSMQE